MYRTAYRTDDVGGLSVFSREAGPQDAPTIVPLHGLASSSRMRPPLDRPAGPFHLVAPDHPGFGHGDMPGHTQFAYTFDHLAAITARFTEVLGGLPLAHKNRFRRRESCPPYVRATAGLNGTQLDLKPPSGSGWTSVTCGKADPADRLHRSLPQTADPRRLVRSKPTVLQ
jgi:hypothetical protein